MNKVFEDEFMDVQSGIIYLCLEVTQKKVDKIFAYCSNERYCKMFNAFFVVDGQVKLLNHLDIPDDLATQFLRIGTHDIIKMDAICKKHNMPAPTEMKLYYDVTTGKFNANYKYEEVCSAKKGRDSVDVFHEWIAEVKETSSNKQGLAKVAYDKWACRECGTQNSMQYSQCKKCGKYSNQ